MSAVARSLWIAMAVVLSEFACLSAAGVPLETLRIALPLPAQIAFEGDSTTYGQDTSQESGGISAINGAGQTRSRVPFPEQLGTLLAGQARISNRGYPGDRTIDALARWQNAQRVDLVFLMYGTNDCANFGRLAGGSVSIGDYRRNLVKLVLHHSSRGEKVVLMTAPPLQDRLLEARLEEYRETMRSVARETHVGLIDISRVIQGVQDKWTDGVHLSVSANMAIASYIKDRLDLTKSTK
ncbi:hypothetical protein JQ543_26555 [Bradyrhizobium diazoefficiens]|nr:GDSL-type esterase/lipase family protein [Bradyrhizobium diazoefficiens]MBR0851334.1 hypothetical protein [Bradyrhizobium diazoefficiens]